MKKRWLFTTLLAAAICVICLALFPTEAKAASVDDLTFTLNSDGQSYAVTGCSHSASGKLRIPATYNGKPVTSIGDYAFEYCERLTSITIPDSVTSIGNSAFEYCDVTSITIPDSVTSIGNYAFIGCCNLTEITIPDGITRISDGAFFECDSLTEITIPDSVTSIGDQAFSYCYSLTDITIPDSVTSIGDEAFSFCGSLIEITIPDSVTSIGDDAFDGCYSLTSITIPDSVTSIGDGAFFGCDSLTKITIPDSVTSIGNHAFMYCYSLTSVTIGSGVTSIGDYPFMYCHSLTGIWVSEGNPNYSSDAYGVLFNKAKTELICAPGGLSGSYTIPDSVTSIGDYAFSGVYYSLSSVTIPDSVTSIGDHAFYECYSLTSVTIPDSVTSIGDYAFFECDSLTSVTIGSGVTSIGIYAFWNCSSLTDVYYAGTERKWEEIEIDPGKNHFGYATIHYNHTHDYSLIPAVTVPATCTEAGYTEYTCAYGEKHRADYVPAGHIKGTDAVVVAPTCGSRGYTESTCPRCKLKVQTDYVESVGHSMVYKAAEAATCTKDGHTEGTLCSRCGLLGTATKLEKGHSYKAATCTTPKTCKNCGKTSGKALGHTYKDATCTAPKTCKTCGATSGKALGHSYKDATCTKAKTCKTCGATSGKKLGHTYTNSCDTTCNRCDAKRSISHSYKTTTTKATLKKNGSIVKKCTVCDKVASKKTIKYVKTIKLSATSYTYNGKVKTPTVTVKDSAGNKLEKGTDYTVTYASGRKNSGTYKVTVKFKGNYSGTKTLTFKILPKISTQPKTQKVEAGEKIKFTVKATGTGLKYQWQVSSNGKTWKACSGSAAKKASFSFTSKTSHDGNYYRCKVTDSAGNVVYTKVVRAYVLGIEKQPVKKTVTKNKTAKFSVEATGYNVKYQWQYSTNGGKTWKTCSGSAAKKAIFKFAAKASQNGYYYRCKITDSAKNVIYSSKVKLTVKK